MIWKTSLVLCLVSAVLSYRPAISEQRFQYHHGDLKHIGHHEPEHHEVYAWAYPSYEFSYHVDDPHTHDMKGQHEERDGDKVTGNYWLMQPDGRKRTVKYKSDDKHGFHAEVKYSPHKAHHPHHYKHHHHDIEEHHHDVKDDHHDMKEHHHDMKEHHHEAKKHHHEKKPQYEVKEQHDEPQKHVLHKVIPEIKQHHDDKEHDNSWGWIRPPVHHKHNHHGHEDENHGIRHGHSEHWKHGVLVGWSEGKGYDDDHNHQNDHHEDRDDHHHKHHHHGHESRHNFKPYVPYGHRLH